MLAFVSPAAWPIASGRISCNRTNAASGRGSCVAFSAQPTSVANFASEEGRGSKLSSARDDLLNRLADGRDPTSDECGQVLEGEWLAGVSHHLLLHGAACAGACGHESC